MPSEVRSRTERGVRALRSAVKVRAWADLPECSESGKAEALGQAESFSAEAIALLSAESRPIVASGEVVQSDPDTPRREAIADTLASPTQTAIDASIARTDLLTQVQSHIVALGVDAAHSIGARNSLEKMLAHQLALLHSVSMRTTDKALLQSRDSDRIGLLNATTRMMDTYQRGLLAMERLRTDSSHTVTQVTVQVQHVVIQMGIGGLGPAV